MKTLEVFKREKQEFLSKPDKSRKKSIDEKIKKLLELLNEKDQYYTTSSCSGRIMIYKPGKKKQETEWIYVSHEETKPEEIIDKQGEGVWFKTEGPIIHICCYTLEDATRIIDMFRLNGWKKTGIISLKPKIIVEAATSLLINQPFNDLSKEYIEILVREANQKLRKGWIFIENMEKELSEKKDQSSKRDL